jgi:Flp pilus assembly pilin Flp
VDCSRSRSVLSRRGQALSEYAVLVAIVGMGLVVIIGLFGRATRQVWQRSESKFAGEPAVASGAPSPAPSPLPSGGGAASGSVQPTPPPSAPPPGKPKQDSGDSSSAAADSSGASPGDPLGGSATGQDPTANVP